MLTIINAPSAGGSSLPIHLDRPAGDARCPAIVLMYHREGIDDFTTFIVRRFVDAGYLVAVPDVSHRCPPDMPMKDRKSLLTDKDVVADIKATMSALRARADVIPDRIAIVGHCMGGRMAVLGAGAVAGFRALVDYYGGSVAVSWGNEPKTPFDLIGNITCPVIGFFGNKDKHPSPEDVNRTDAELTRCGIPHVFHRYADVGHGFQNPAHTEPQERAAAEDSWRKMLDFLRAPAGC